MRCIWFSVFCSLLLLGCNNTKSNNSNLLSKIPESSQFVFKINNIEALKSGFRNNKILSEISNSPYTKEFNKKINLLRYLKNNSPIYIGIETDEKDSLNVSVVTKSGSGILNLDSIPNIIVETVKTKTNNYQKISIEDQTFYTTEKDSILFISNNLELTQNSLTVNLTSNKISQLFETSNNEQSVSVYGINLFKKLSVLPDSILGEQLFSGHSVLDIDVSQDNLYLNGITKAIDSTNAFIDHFKGTVPQENKIANFVPLGVESFISFTAQDLSLIKNAVTKKTKSDSLNLNLKTFQNIVEFGKTTIDAQELLFMRSIDPFMTFEELEAEQVANSFRSVDIYSANTSEFLDYNIIPGISTISPLYYINLEDVFIFSEGIEVLQTVISNYQNNSVLSESQYFKDLMSHLSDESSIFLFYNSESLQEKFQTFSTKDIKIDLEPYNASAVQFVYDTDFAHVNAVFQTSKGKKLKDKISEEVNITIDAELTTTPQFVENYTNNQMDVVVQDVDNSLYLMANRGKIFWKKQIDGKILGKIEQIDMYKNGRLQLAFVTSNQLYVIDRNGKDVAPFPLKFKDKITQPLSIFDYNNKRNYRLLVTQGKSLLMFDALGKKISGFNYASNEKNIASQPKHFRIGTKDYIVFARGEEMTILNRVGKTRIPVKEPILFSENDIYLYDNHFTTTNTNGELLKINQNGSVKHENLNLVENHKITSTSKTLVTLSENKLTIKSKTIPLDFGNYTAPVIFYLNDKIYVSTTDLQSKKVYLFDSQANSISNFPVYGNSTIDMQNIDKDQNLEIVVKGGDNSVIIYELN